ncbi:5-carboxy-2-oxohept-3-enedioate decarboxylase HpaG1 subunit [Bacillus oleivorans]|uniref:5-carboxy-2-oxohept-3-enedioate decarboxylase HpaG1 subunit n=1 Tax=Bacillus oleivorans TaxID=1448271 RepID=A0A285CMA7_9BACI|nr:fumarylacetoacetate hydrolase family protein [Bacillus oleivorans]SNX68700.1 5-carboxy-2-oxohept-3-enedioate decarboxylase HpaG1 subunit [Bacillus oleivorans]
MTTATFRLAGRSQIIEASVNPSQNTADLNGRTIKPEQIKLDAPVTGTVYGTLLNYQGNLEALSEALNQKPYYEPPKAPILYIKPKNTWIGSGADILLPSDINELEVGASLGIVIEKTATRIKKQAAFDYIAGYTIVNDISVPHFSFFRPAVKHKARDSFCPIGPWVVKKSAIENPDALTIRVFVNGEVMQENNTANLIRSVSKLLKDVTEFMTLYQGDVLLVGVPENAPLVRDQDLVRIEIEGIGALENRVISEERLFGGASL